uniref:MARVEL domain-containing protein n=1 Tax=Panagrolaimus davidi TaxID=227884 RepID=A0A914QQC9_9BILA
MVQSSYNPPDPKYRCFCGLLYVKTGTYIICYATVACLILKTIAELVAGKSLFPTIFFSNLFTAFVCACAIYGVAVEKAEFLIPYLVCSFLLLACSVLVFVMGLITLIVSPRDIVPYVSSRRNWDDSYRGWDNGQRGWDDEQLGYDYRQIRWNDDGYVAKDDTASEVITFFVVVLALLAFHAWTYMIVYRCYQLFVAKKEAARLPTHQVPSFPLPSFPNPSYEKVPETKPILKDVVL